MFNIFKPSTIPVETISVMVKLPEDTMKTRFPFFYLFAMRMGTGNHVMEAWEKRFQEEFCPGNMQSYMADFRTWKKCSFRECDDLQNLRIMNLS